LYAPENVPMHVNANVSSETSADMGRKHSVDNIVSNTPLAIEHDQGEEARDSFTPPSTTYKRDVYAKLHEGLLLDTTLEDSKYDALTEMERQADTEGGEMRLLCKEITDCLFEMNEFNIGSMQLLFK
jgi:hypothetical protein